MGRLRPALETRQLNAVESRALFAFLELIGHDPARVGGFRVRVSPFGGLDVEVEFMADPDAPVVRTSPLIVIGRT